MTQRTCTVDGCSKPHNAKGLCITHYQRMRKHGDVFAGVQHLQKERTPRLCSVSGCERRHKGRGFCQPHLKAHKIERGETPQCSVNACDQPAEAKHLCNAHYLRTRAKGTTDAPARLTAEEREQRQRESDRRYKERNRELIRQRARARYAANPEPERARHRRYHALHRQHLNEASRRWYHANREYAAQRLAEWYRANPLRARAIWQAKRVRRKRWMLGTRTGPISFRAILATCGMHCHICDQAIPSLDDLHFDHVIPLARGGTHTADNIRPSHAACNLRKGAKILGPPNGKRLLAAAPSGSGAGADEHMGFVVVGRP